MGRGALLGAAAALCALSAVLGPAGAPVGAQPTPQPDREVAVERTWFGTGPQLSIRETTVRRSTGAVLSSRVVVDPCGYRVMTPEDGSQYVTNPPGTTPGVDGRFVARACGVIGVFTATVVWVYDVDPAPAAGITVAEVLEALDLTLDEVAFSPAGRQLTGLPSWFWVPPEAWQRREVTVALGGAVATAAAVPVLTRWLVDGDEVVRCTGPGVPYRPGPMPPEACTHTFTERSESTRLELRVSWRVSIVLPGGVVEVVPDFEGPPAERDLVVVDARAVVG
jgi:hypothetical protein